MKIEYGIESKKIDVTEICKTKLCKKNIIYIPETDDDRNYYFNDPIPNTIKYIFITLNDKTTKHKFDVQVNINLSNNTIIINNNITSLGFIIIRHVNSPITNQYWKYSYDCIRKYYPEHNIVIIDDNSHYNHITSKELYKTEIIESEYNQRGELLPYYYYLHNKYFDNAVIIHDSVFINSYIDFNLKNKIIDITNKLNTNIKTNTDTDKNNNNKLSFQFVNYNNLFGDPCINQPKLLTIKYKYINNKICKNIFNENQNFTLNYKQIVSAFYGNNNKKTDVTNIILDFIKYNNYLFIDKTKYNNLFGDPCINQFKQLTVKYKNINDQICVNIFNENENFTLNYKQIVSASYGVKENYKKLWNFNNHRHDNHCREHTLINSLKNNNDLKQFYNNKSLWSGCFGAMSVINHDYLVYLNNIYNIDNLLNVVTNRSMRMGLERVLACMLQKHSGSDNVMFGDIQDKNKWRWSLNWHNKHRVGHLPIIKIWSGR